MKLNIFSDLRKPGLVPGKSLSLAQNYVFCFGETLIYIHEIIFMYGHIEADVCVHAYMDKGITALISIYIALCYDIIALC